MRVIKPSIELNKLNKPRTNPTNFDQFKFSSKVLKYLFTFACNRLKFGRKHCFVIILCPLWLYETLCKSFTYDFHVIDETIPMGPRVFSLAWEGPNIDLLRRIEIVQSLREQMYCIIHERCFCLLGDKDKIESIFPDEKNLIATHIIEPKLLRVKE